MKKSKTMPANDNLGFEYHYDVANDIDYYQKIFESNTYHQNPNLPVKLPVVNQRTGFISNNKENESPGSFEGQKLVKSVGTTMTSSLSAHELEMTLGKYASKKLGKKGRNKNGFIQEEFYLIKIKWLVKMARIQHQTHKYNLNNFRLTIEKIIKEASPAFEIQLFQKQKKIAKRLKKLSNFLAKLDPQKAILLSYKLFKIYLKQGDINDPQTQLEIANKFHNMFLPYIKLMEIKQVHPKEKTQKKRANLVTYKKIKKFSQKPYILNILNKYPDPKKTPEWVVQFTTFLREKVSLEKALRELTIQGKEVVLEKQIIPGEGLIIEGSHVPDIIKTLDTFDHTHISQRNFCDKSFEDAMSFELAEKQSRQGEPCLQNYIFQKKCTLMERQNSGRPQANHYFAEQNANSEDSSNENQLDEGETEQELMDDPELYERKESSKGSGENRENNRIELDLDNETVLGPLRLEGTYSTPGTLNLSPHRNRGNTCQGRDYNICTKADPLRVSQRLELMKMNSYDNIPQPEERQRQMEDELGSPTKLNKDEYMPMRVSQRMSTSKSLSMTKTKKEMAFQKVLGIAYDTVSKWEKVMSCPKIKIEKIKPENSPVLLLRAWAVIEGFSPMEVFEQIYNTEKRVKWDTVTAGISTVESIDETSDVIHFIIKTPFGITERDFLQRRDYIFDYPEKGTITMSFVSCVHPLKPPTKNRIRGETHIAGYIIKPSATKPCSTDLCVLTQCDIKGKVPKAIVNMVASRAPADWVTKLTKACERSRSGHH